MRGSNARSTLGRRRKAENKNEERMTNLSADRFIILSSDDGGREGSRSKSGKIVQSRKKRDL